MKELSNVTVTLTNVKVSNLIYEQQEVKGIDATLRSRTKGSSTKAYSSVIENNASPSWSSWDPVTFKDTSYLDLLNDGVAIKIRAKNLGIGKVLGTATINFVNLLTPDENKKYTIREDIQRAGGQGSIIGTIEAQVQFLNLPLYAQLEGGIHTETSCTGRPLFPSLPVPEKYVFSVNQQPVRPSSSNTPQPSPQQPSPNVPTPVSGGSGGQSPLVNEPVLPPGWERRVEPTTKRVYYVDHNTKTTHWVPPNVVVKPQPIVQNVPQQPSPVLPVYNTQAPLPPGWEERKDQQTGRVYYVNHHAKTTTWTDPRKIPQQAPPNWVQNVQQGPPPQHFQNQPQQAPTNIGPPLPPGWEMRLDVTTGRPYYLNHVMKTTQWDRPLL